MNLRIFFFIKLLVLAFISSASALVIGSDEEEIYIDANFSGKNLLVFGAFYSDPSQARDDKSDILIEVVGPSEDVVIRKKESFFGFWLNSKSVEFNDVPGFYYLSSTSEITNEFLTENNIGLLNKKDTQLIDWSALNIDWGNIRNEEDKDSFYDALIRTKEIEDAYRKVNGEIDIIDGNLFRSYIEIPNTVPVGQYKVNLYLIIDSKISNEYSYNFMVTRVGIEEAIYSFSKNYPLIYGLISLLIAILIGWSGAEVFKRFRKV